MTEDEITALFPVPGDRVKCGLRTDLPRAQRRHTWADMGIDTRNHGEAGFRDVPVRACITCGTDRKS